MSVIPTRCPETHATPPPMAIATRISAMFCSPGVRNVLRIATNMPAPAHRMPPRAVTGELMRFRPKMNRIDAMK